MKKSCIALILLMLSIGTLYAKEYYECFLTSCGPMICLTFAREISIEECLIYSDYYEAMYCDVKDVDPGIGGGVQ